MIDWSRGSIRFSNLLKSIDNRAARASKKSQASSLFALGGFRLGDGKQERENRLFLFELLEQTVVRFHSTTDSSRSSREHVTTSGSTHNGGSTHAFSLHTHDPERRETYRHTHTHTRSVSLAFFHGAITLCFRSGYASTREKRFLDRINIEITARVTRHTVAATPVASRDSYLRIYRPRAEVERPRKIRAEEGGWGEIDAIHP